MIDKILSFFGLQRKQDRVVEQIVREVIKEVEVVPKPPQHNVLGHMCIDYIVGEKVKFFAHSEQEEVGNDLRKKLAFFTLRELEVLVKIISVHYRENAIYDYLFTKGYTWEISMIPIGKIYLTKINKKTNMYLEQLQTPYRLTEALEAYKTGKIPKDCELFQKDERVIENFMPVCVNRVDGIYVIDGNHRICRYILSKKMKQLPVFLGTKND